MDWNDVRAFASVADAGSLTSAARRDGRSIATLGRRIASMEQAVGFVVFERNRDGVVLTARGVSLLQDVRHVVEAMAVVARRAAALREGGWTDPIRVSSTEPVIADILAPALPRLLRQAPELRIDLVSEVEVVSLAAREADIAIRFVKPEGSALVVRRLPSIRMRLHASRTYLCGREPATLNLKSERLLVQSDVYGPIPEATWAHRSGFAESVVARISSTRGLIAASKAGAGIALLPTLLIQSDDDRVEVPMPKSDQNLVPDRDLWLVVHGDLRRAAPLKVVRRWIVDAFGAAKGTGRPVSIGLQNKLPISVQS